MKLMRLLLKRVIFAPNKVIGSQQKESNDHYCPSETFELPINLLTADQLAGRDDDLLHQQTH